MTDRALRFIPNTKCIKSYFHCGTCLPDKPFGMSPSEWSSLECGWTVIGFQVWCKRCDLNVAHIDFQRQQHPANVLARRREGGG